MYVLACRIGPFARKFHRQINNLGGKMYVNPDGHEWMRAKWSKPIRWYWKKSEQLMVKNCDLLICDSRNIEKYIHKSYENTIQRLHLLHTAPTLPRVSCQMMMKSLLNGIRKRI